MRRSAIFSLPALLLLAGCAAQVPPAAPRELEIACGMCHRLAAPDVLPRERWREEVTKMVDIASRRLMRMPIEAEEAIRWYEAAAPRELPEAPGRSDAGPGAVRWNVRPVTPPGGPPNPAVANVRFIELLGGPGPDLVVSDMRHPPGVVSLVGG